MDRAAFYASLRRRDSGVFGTSLSQRQVDGTNALLEAAKGLPLQHAAHVMGEVYHETGGGMYPVKETVFRGSKNQNPSDATVIARLDRAWAKGQLPWVRSPYWRGGWFGRGQLQVTHRANYEKCSAMTEVDQVSDPSRALELPVSAANAVEGCRAGIFTGRKLADYGSGETYDHVNARAIVNGDKHVNGVKVAKYARAFAAAMEAAGWSASLSPEAPPAQEVPPRKPVKLPQMTEAKPEKSLLYKVLQHLFG